MVGGDCDSSGGELKSKEDAGGFAGLGGVHACDASNGELETWNPKMVPPQNQDDMPVAAVIGYHE